MGKVIGAGVLALLLSSAVIGAAPEESEPALPVRYMQRNQDGSYRLIAKFINRGACDVYRSMQAQIVCRHTSLCKNRPELCRGSGGRLSVGPTTCWHDPDKDPDPGYCF